MTDPIDTARAEGIALGLAMAAQKYQDMDVMDDDGFPAWDYFSAAHHAILALAPIPPHVAAARVLLDMPEALAPVLHAHYERLAPAFGYETRRETRHFDAQSPNGKLMVAAIRAALEQIAQDE